MFKIWGMYPRIKWPQDLSKEDQVKIKKEAADNAILQFLVIAALLISADLYALVMELLR